MNDSGSSPWAHTHPRPAARQTGVNGTSFLTTSIPRTSAQPNTLESSMSSFHPRSVPQSYTTETQGPLASASELDHIERKIDSFNTEHRLNITHLQEGAQRNTFELSELKDAVQSNFQTVSTQLQASSLATQEMNARIAAIDEERKLMKSFMISRTLAEAESLELQARRLREGVRQIEEPQAGGARSMLQIKSAPSRNENETTAGSIVPVAENTPGTPTTAPKWLPHAMVGLTPLVVPSIHKETFTWEEVHRLLGGAQYSPGIYLTRNDSGILQGRTYWLLEAQYEPFAPTVAGHHGAKLTAFYNDNPTEDGDFVTEEDYLNVPVFVCLAEGQGYTYLGQYSQKRFSDQLSHSELFRHVSLRVLKYWSVQLSDHQRPEWVTEKLTSHFWPAPTYEGPIPTDSAVSTPGTGVSQPEDAETILEKRVLRGLERFAGQLKDWKKASRIKANLLSEQAIMESWAKSDVDEEKGLRLWLEYLECVGFDEDFYRKLVALKNGKVEAPARDQLRPAGPAKVDGQKATENVAGNSCAIQSDRKDDRTQEVTSTRSRRPANIKIVSPSAAENEGPRSKAVRGEQHGSTTAAKVQAAPTLRAYPSADLKAAREMHDNATKAGEKKARGGKAASRPIKW